jgi:hypothetical protein
MQPFDPWGDADLAAVAELDRAEARAFAARAEVLARMLRSASAKALGWDGSAPWAGLVMEVAGTSRVSQRTAENRLGDARHLVDHLPATHAAMSVGDVLVPHALVLISETLTSTADVCAEVEQRVLAAAREDTPAQFRKRVRKAVMEADAVAAEQAHERAAQDRSTWVKPAPDGMAMQGAYLTAVQGRRFDADLTALLGRTATVEGDDRTVEQRRADLLADLPGLTLELLDRSAGVLPPLGIPPVVDRWFPGMPAPTGTVTRRRRRATQVVVHVPVSHMVDLTRGLVWLDGYGWITRGQGMALLTEAELRKACVDARTGRLITVEPPFVPGQDDPRQRDDGRPTAISTLDVAELADDVEQLRQAWERAALAATAAEQVLRDALQAEGDRLPHEVTPEPGRSSSRTTGRLAPEDASKAVHEAILRMVAEPAVVADDDPGFRVEPEHDPSEAVREVVDLRDSGCDGPGCSVPATVSDLDHEKPWPAGVTSALQLRVRSRRCHGAKHHGWCVRVDTRGWSTWTSPGGRSYRRSPRYDPPPQPERGRRPRNVLGALRADGSRRALPFGA